MMPATSHAAASEVQVRLAGRFGDFALDCEARFAAYGVTVLVGPSGSGKTTLLRCIAGLERASGLVQVGQEIWQDDARFVPAHRRGAGYVFQEGRLFPHFSVRRNLDYGRWMRGLPRDEAAFRHICQLLDIGALLDRRPGALSGGERQRVALGRALLMQPRLLLLDEPLASLDAARKREILPYFQRLRDEAKVPMIYVSHDAGEVKALASRVVLLEDGRVKAAGGTELL
jgi:molybdate transport system ATP-binding protein